MCQFESEEACESRFFAVNLSARGRESYWCETLYAARSRHGLGVGLARDPSNVGRRFSLKFLCE